MKTSIFVFCFFCTTAFAQSVLTNVVQPFQAPDHPQHATEHAMAQESSLLSASTISYAKGEVPLAELGSPIYQTPLGDIARAVRKEHATVPKATKSMEN